MNPRKSKPKRFIARFWVTYEGKGWIKTIELEAKDIYAAYRTAKQIADSSDYVEFASVDDAPPRKTFREWLSLLFAPKKGKTK